MSAVAGPNSGTRRKVSSGLSRLRLHVAACLGLAAVSLAIILAAVIPRLADGMEFSAALQTPAAGPRYELAARVSLPHGFIKEAAWLDASNYIALVLSPDGAAVWKLGYSAPSRLKFMSSSFLEERICPAQLAPRLSWVVSPTKRYICFMWFKDDGAREWALVDISGAPEFKLKRFTPPAGMQVARALFSPDDRYLVLVHDGLREGSAASVVTLDLDQGLEVWRIGTHELNFITELWWGGAVYDAPKFCAVASLSDGQFHEDPGLAVCDIKTQQLEYTPGQQSLLLGADALWGKVVCYATAQQSPMPFFLEATIPGERPHGSIPLSARPVQLQMLPAPGLVLINNTVDYVTNQLWLLDVLSGDKHPVDEDCAAFSLAADNKLLVRGQAKSELRVYELIQPGAEPGPSAAAQAPPNAGEPEQTPPDRQVLPVEF